MQVLDFNCTFMISFGIYSRQHIPKKKMFIFLWGGVKKREAITYTQIFGHKSQKHIRLDLRIYVFQKLRFRWSTPELIVSGREYSPWWVSISPVTWVTRFSREQRAWEFHISSLNTGFQLVQSRVRHSSVMLGRLELSISLFNRCKCWALYLPISVRFLFDSEDSKHFVLTVSGYKSSGTRSTRLSSQQPLMTVSWLLLLSLTKCAFVILCFRS